MGPETHISRTTVLVVDDTDAIRRGVSLLLGLEGFRVRSAADGHEALASIAADPPDLVLLDLNMPGMDGFGVLQALAARLDGRPVPVAVYSAAGDPAARRRAALLGAVDFLDKGTLGWDELAGRVRTLVGRFAPPLVPEPGAARDARGWIIAR